jgi:hypothetical protein
VNLTLWFGCQASYGTAGDGIPYIQSLLVEVRVSSDGGPQLERLWDTAASTVFNVYDAYGWIVPALLLSLLFLGLLVLLLSLLAPLAEGLEIEPEFLQGFGGIFRWTRESWQSQGDRSQRGGMISLFHDEDRRD